MVHSVHIKMLAWSKRAALLTCLIFNVIELFMFLYSALYKPYLVVKRSLRRKEKTKARKVKVKVKMQHRVRANPSKR